MMLQQTQLKVEPCKSAGPKTKKLRHDASHQNGGGKQRSGSAPKVSTVLRLGKEHTRPFTLMNLYRLCNVSRA